MAIKVIDPIEIANTNKDRTKVFNTRRMHAWVHYYPRPGDHDTLHCHNADQMFICLEGQCMMSFQDGSRSVLDPGMAALIQGGSFYQLENSGDGPMIMMGTRSGPEDAVVTIDHATRENLTANGKRPAIYNRFDEEAKAKGAETA